MTDGPLHPNCHPELVSGSLKGIEHLTTASTFFKATILDDAEINSA